MRPCHLLSSFLLISFALSSLALTAGCGGGGGGGGGTGASGTGSAGGKGGKGVVVVAVPTSAGVVLTYSDPTKMSATVVGSNTVYTITESGTLTA